MVNMFQTLETKLNSISAGVDSLRADVAGLQALQPILLVQPSLIRRGDSPSKPSLHLLFLLDLQSKVDELMVALHETAHTMKHRSL